MGCRIDNHLVHGVTFHHGSTGVGGIRWGPRVSDDAHIPLATDVGNHWACTGQVFVPGLRVPIWTVSFGAQVTKTAGDVDEDARGGDAGGA